MLLCSEFHSLSIPAWTTVTGCLAQTRTATDRRIWFLSEKVVRRSLGLFNSHA